MTSKERVIHAIQCKEVDRVPWVPFVGCHGATLINVSAEEYLKSTQHIIDGVQKAVELYNPDGIPVLFDLQVEAEVLGCKLKWADNNPPAVISHPLANGTSLKSLKIPEKGDGRVKMAIEATEKIREMHPDIALYGLITGPFTLALHLLGTDIFMKMFEAPDEINEIMRFATDVGKAMAEYYIDAGCDIIAVVDPMTSQIDPESFDLFVTKYATEIFEHIRQKGAFSSFFVCGHARQNIEVMTSCKPDNISIDENIPLDYVRDIALQNNVSFGGNMKLTVVLLMGSKEDAQKDALDCMDIGGQKGFILAPGCDLPMATPVENIQAVTQLVQDPYQQDVIRALESTQNELELLNLKDYGKAEKVIVDIITLDSESCAPCQYMVEAVKKVAPHFEGIVEWREHPIKNMEAVTFMSSLMVKNIPTICIDGKIEFVSQIPSKNVLIAAIQKRINEKLKLKIKAKKSELYILCKDENECNEYKASLNQAMNELGKKIPVKIISDKNEIAAYGVTKTPAVILAEYKLKPYSEIPSLEIIKEWLMDM